MATPPWDNSATPPYERKVLLSHFLLSSTDSLFFFYPFAYRSHIFIHYANITIIFRYSKLSPIKLRSSGWFEL